MSEHEVEAVLAASFDEWLHRMHGVISSCDHHVEAEAMARDLEPLIAERERVAAERAWTEGHAAGRDYQGDGWNSDVHDPAEDNPYSAPQPADAPEGHGDADEAEGDV